MRASWSVCGRRLLSSAAREPPAAEAGAGAGEERRPALRRLPASAWEYEYARHPDVDVVDLREELEELGLPTHGARDELVARLAAFHEETDIVAEGWFEFFDKLSDAKVLAELRARQLPTDGARSEQVARLAAHVEAEERGEVAALIAASYETGELRRQLFAMDLAVDGTHDELSQRLAAALDDLEREEIKDIDDSDPARSEARAEAVMRRQMQRLLDAGRDPALLFRDSEAALRAEMMDEGDDLSLPRVQRLSEQPNNPASPNYIESEPVRQLDATSEELILKDGFSDYATGLAAFFKHCVEADSLGQRWIDTSVSMGGNFMRTKDLTPGKYHWRDEQYRHGIISIKISERSLGTVRTFDRSVPNQEVVQTNVIMVDLNDRKLHCLQIKRARNEAEPRGGHAKATYELNSNWVTAFKKVMWPENFDGLDVHWFLPVNNGPLIDSIVEKYPLTELKD